MQDGMKALAIQSSLVLVRILIQMKLVMYVFIMEVIVSQSIFQYIHVLARGDWSISNYDAVYEIREEGNPMYMMFYEANGTVYMDYSSPNRNAGVLELVQRYISLMEFAS